MFGVRGMGMKASVRLSLSCTVLRSGAVHGVRMDPGGIVSLAALCDSLVRAGHYSAVLKAVVRSASRAGRDSISQWPRKNEGG